jgi:hypothetical protein
MINSPPVCPGQTNGPLPLVCADNECGLAVRAISELMAHTLAMSRILYRNFFLASAAVLVAVWSLPEGRPLTTLQGHENIVWALSITPDGKTLASGSNDKTVKLWSLPEGRLLATLEGHTGGPVRLVFTPDGRVLVSGQRGIVVARTGPYAAVQGAEGRDYSLELGSAKFS